ncbi:unnamed protein product [Dracunculus medinensis]|uniref:Dehydrogenase with different specificities related to short-chain alcohol dehydrogenase n=1 Tax=Dracunculus medinensis TaxID=318479 RepID=A0A0N4U0T1_DRAME|nr:unnamed protein product [Dracunculus medinensis]
MLDDVIGLDSLKVPLYGVLAFVGLYFTRRYFKGAQFREIVSVEGKVALITGSNSGIGKQIARELNIRGAELGCNPTRLIIKSIDLANFQSIRSFIKDFSSEVERVDILINNAGIMFYPRFELTVDGNELTWQTNYLGHFLLTELLRPLLEKSNEGRIINVSSALHKRADSVDESVVYNPEKFNRYQPYCRSKLALVRSASNELQIMHAVELTRVIRLANPSSRVTINALHPGDGAQTPLYLALSKDVEGVSGKYFGECKEHKPSQKALNPETCSLLYNYSIEAVGLGTPSP